MAASGNYIVESDVVNWPTSVDTTEDFATTAVVIATDKITVVNDIDTGTEIQFSSTGVVPAPLVTGTIYYAINIDATHIQVASTPVLAAAGTAVNLTDVGSGTHTLDVGDGSSTAERQAVINRAEQLIEKLTKDYFYSKAFVVYRDGNGCDWLPLGLQPDILANTSRLFLSDLAMVQDSTTLTSAVGGFTAGMVGELIYISAGTNFVTGWYEITGHTDTNTVTLDSTAATAGNGSAGSSAMGGVIEILVYGIALETSWYTFDANDVYLDPESATGGIDDPELLLRMGKKQGLFSKGNSNIKITGTYGWTTCPPAIKQAAIILCRYENDETLYTKYEDVESDKLDDASYSRGSKRFMTGLHEADRLIRNYKRLKPMLGAC